MFLTLPKKLGSVVLNFLKGSVFVSNKKGVVLKFTRHLRLNRSQVFLTSEKSEARVLKKVVLKKKKAGICSKAQRQIIHLELNRLCVSYLDGLNDS